MLDETCVSYETTAIWSFSRIRRPTSSSRHAPSRRGRRADAENNPYIRRITCGE